MLKKFEDREALMVTIATAKFKSSSTPDYIDSTSYTNVTAEEQVCLFPA